MGRQVVRGKHVSLNLDELGFKEDMLRHRSRLSRITASRAPYTTAIVVSACANERVEKEVARRTTSRHDPQDAQCLRVGHLHRQHRGPRQDPPPDFNQNDNPERRLEQREHFHARVTGVAFARVFSTHFRFLPAVRAILLCTLPRPNLR